nr:retrovirus-related Pol polyprotein from transposon TNT 1-94 [Tanacetum cinerariifolium]
MAAGSRDRPPMFTPERYPQWRLRFLRYVDTRPNGKALRKYILSGPYKLTTVLVQAVEATDDSPAVPEHTTPEWSRFVTIVKQQHKLNEVSYHKLFDILKQYQNEVNELHAERLARNANPLALVATAQADRDQYYQTSRSHRSFTPLPKSSIPSRSHTMTRHKGNETAKPITPPSETVSKEDSDPKQAQRDKDMQKNLALIAKYFKKIYKPTKNNLRTSSNSKNKNVDTTPWFKNDNQSRQFRNQRTVNVAEAKENVEVPIADSGTDFEPVEQVQNDAGYNVFANHLQHSKQYESVSNICLVETNDSNVILDSPDMCDNNIQNEQNDVDSDDKSVAFANLIANLKLDTKKAKFEKYKAFNDCTVDYDKLERLSQVKARPVEFKPQEIKFCEKIRGIERDVEVRNNKIEYLMNELEQIKKEKEGLDNKLTGFESASKDLDTLLGKLPEFVDDIVTDYSRPTPTIDSSKSNISDLQNNNFSVFEHGESSRSIMSKPMINFVKAVDCPEVIKTNKTKIARKSLVKYAEIQFNTARPKAVINAVRTNRVNDVKALTCWVWKPIKPNSASITLKRYDYLDVRGRSGSAMAWVPKKAQSEIPCLYAFPYDQNTHANRVIPDEELTLALERESQSKLNKHLVRPYDYTTLNSLYEIFKPQPRKIVDNAWIKHSKDQLRAPTAQDIEILIQTCLMPLAIKTHSDSLKFVHELKKEMHADLKYIESLKKEIDELKSDKAEFSDIYFPKAKSVPKANVSEGLSKPVTAQTLPQTVKKAVSNTNVLKPGMYIIDNRTTQTRAPQLPQTVRNTNIRVSTSTGVNHKPNVSIPQFAQILGYGDLVQGNVTINRVYNVKGLNHNLFSVGLFCDADLEKDIVIGLPKLKYVKDQLCSSCELSKAKRSSFKSKVVTSSKGRLNLLHIDLCDLMRVASINGKKCILVIVDDYSRYTWTLFLRSKDKTPEVLKDFLTMIQRNLQASLITVRTNRGTEFLNKTLNAFFKEEGIEHQTLTAQTPKQNSVVER